MELTNLQLGTLIRIQHALAIPGRKALTFYFYEEVLCDIIEQLAQLGLVTLVTKWSATLTTEGVAFLKSYPLCKLVYVLDGLGWYVLAGDCISNLSMCKLAKFIAHDYFYYRDKAIARYSELVRGQLL